MMIDESLCAQTWHSIMGGRYLQHREPGSARGNNLHHKNARSLYSGKIDSVLVGYIASNAVLF